MRYARITNKYGPELGAIAAQSFIAAVELLFGFGALDHSVDHITIPAASAFLLAAALLVWIIVRTEHRQLSGG
jgi:hypothetical protein